MLLSYYINFSSFMTLFVNSFQYYVIISLNLLFWFVYVSLYKLTWILYKGNRKWSHMSSVGNTIRRLYLNIWGLLTYVYTYLRNELNRFHPSLKLCVCSVVLLWQLRNIHKSVYLPPQWYNTRIFCINQITE